MPDLEEIGAYIAFLSLVSGACCLVGFILFGEPTPWRYPFVALTVLANGLAFIETIVESFDAGS